MVMDKSCLRHENFKNFDGGEKRSYKSSVMNSNDEQAINRFLEKYRDELYGSNQNSNWKDIMNHYFDKCREIWAKRFGLRHDATYKEIEIAKKLGLKPGDKENHRAIIAVIFRLDLNASWDKIREAQYVK